MIESICFISFTFVWMFPYSCCQNLGSGKQLRDFTVFPTFLSAWKSLRSSTVSRGCEFWSKETRGNHCCYHASLTRGVESAIFRNFLKIFFHLNFEFEAVLILLVTKKGLPVRQFFLALSYYKIADTIGVFSKLPMFAHSNISPWLINIPIL